MTLEVPAVHLHLHARRRRRRRGSPTSKSLLSIHSHRRPPPSPHQFACACQTTTISAGIHQSQRQHVLAAANRQLCLLHVLCPLRTLRPCLLPVSLP